MQAGLISEPSFPTALPLRQRIIIFALVIIAHGVLLSQQWVDAPDFMGASTRELSVTIVQKPSPRTLLPSTTNHRQVTQPESNTVVPVEPSPVMTPAPPVDMELPAPSLSDLESAIEQSHVSALPDSKPDYRADYLDNPQPKYPLIARRKGWQGKVVLEVEVLADGSPGEIGVQQSSGRNMLDNAALRAVQSWQFIPASRAGLPITQRFLVPIVFNLK